jgi:hypothetical protein
MTLLSGPPGALLDDRSVAELVGVCGTSTPNFLTVGKVGSTSFADAFYFSIDL